MAHTKEVEVVHLLSQVGICTCVFIAKYGKVKSRVNWRRKSKRRLSIKDKCYAQYGMGIRSM